MQSTYLLTKLSILWHVRVYSFINPINRGNGGIEVVGYAAVLIELINPVVSSSNVSSTATVLATCNESVVCLDAVR